MPGKSGIECDPFISGWASRKTLLDDVFVEQIRARESEDKSRQPMMSALTAGGPGQKS